MAFIEVRRCVDRGLASRAITIILAISFGMLLFVVTLTLGLAARLAETAEVDGNQFRAARSVHLHYPAPESILFYNEVVVEKSVNGSYFMACGWNTGYCGLQQLGAEEDKVVLFSVWDPSKGDDPNAVKRQDRVEVLYQGEGVRIKRFGGEGTGGQCLWRQNWLVGETNEFIVQASVEEEKTAYTAWFRSAALHDWKKLATFRVPHGGAGALRGYYSFIEDFRRDMNSVKEIRRARFGNGWLKDSNGAWTRLGKARFTASNSEWESKDNIDAGCVDGWFFMATGGDLNASKKLGATFELAPAPASPPPWLLSFPQPTANPGR